MQLYLDENVERRVANELRRMGHDVYEVTKDENTRNKGVLDKTHALEAEKSNRILITQDVDYGKLRVRDNVPSTGVVYAKPSLVDAPDYEKRMVVILKEHEAALERGAFITVSVDKVRVRELEMEQTQETKQPTDEQQRRAELAKALRESREREDREDEDRERSR